MDQQIDIRELVFSPRSLRLGWERYIRSTLRDAKDYIGIRVFSSKLDDNLSRLSECILSGEYRPERPPKFFRPKSSGMQRTMTILGIDDALVFQTIANHVATRVYDELQTNFEFVFGSVLHEEVRSGLVLLDNPDAEFYFFRPWQLLYHKFADSVNRSVLQSRVKFKVETDITGFYDSIPHFTLLNKIVLMCGLDDSVCNLLAECLNIWSGTEQAATPGVGIPQGTIASHFFANLFLHDLDNLVRYEGLPYYRYMDDIRIYGDGEDELRRVLLKIDSHLKCHALSLNAKKTSIERIVAETQSEALIYFPYEGEEEEPTELTADDVVDFDESLSADDQTSVQRAQVDDAQEAVVICKQIVANVKDRISEVARHTSRNDIDFDDRSVQREYIRLAFKFRQAIGILRSMGKSFRLPKGKTRDGWLFLANRYFWSINQFCWVLQLYENDKTVKAKLLQLYERYGDYEWVQHQILRCLALSQEFDGPELRMLFQKISQSNSWYVKVSGYMLLLHNTEDRQFYRSIVSRAAEESGELRRQLVFMDQLWQDNGIPREELMELLGVR